jgi:hypothetical protein
MAVFGDIFGGIFSKQRPRQAEDMYYTERPWWWPEGTASPQPLPQPVVVGPLTEDRGNHMTNWLLWLLGLTGGGYRQLEPPRVGGVDFTESHVPPLWWLSILGRGGGER